MRAVLLLLSAVAAIVDAISVRSHDLASRKRVHG